MKNIFYSSNAHAEIFKNNTRSNFNSYIDIHHLEYLHDDDIEAAIKSITYDDKTFVAIRKNLTKPDLIIKHALYANVYPSLVPYYESHEKRIYTAPDLSRSADYLVVGNGDMYEKIYQVDHRRNFCDLQILTPTYSMHNIYLHDINIYTKKDLIRYLNDVLKNVSFYSSRTLVKVVKDLLEEGKDGAVYLKSADYDIYIGGDLANILNLEDTNLKVYSGTSLRNVFRWLKPKIRTHLSAEFVKDNFIHRANFPNDSLDIIFDYRQYLQYFKVRKRMKSKKLNLMLSGIETLYGIKSNISEILTVRNAGYDDIISVFVGNKTNDIVHIDFKNPTFFPTRKELLSRATFQIIDVASNTAPNFAVGSPTYIQVVVRKKKNMEKKFNIFLDSSCEKSKAVYPENNATNFTIDLPERLSFRRDWQVTLKSLFIPDSIRNVPQCFLHYMQGTLNHPDGFILKHKIDLKLEEGNYSSIDSILNELSAQISKAQLPIRIELYEGKVKIACETVLQSDTVVSIMMSRDMTPILGFTKGYENFDGFNLYGYDFKIAPYEPNLFATYPKNLIIGCDVVDNTIFGGEHVKLLRMVTNSQHSTSKILSFEFLQNEYVDLNVKEFKSIKIGIMDATGNFLKTDSSTPTRLQLTFNTV